MEKIDIVLWVIAGGFAVTFSLMKIMFSKIEKLSDKIDKVDEKVNNVDKRLFGVEAILQMKECCMLKNENQSRKAE